MRSIREGVSNEDDGSSSSLLVLGTDHVLRGLLRGINGSNKITLQAPFQVLAFNFLEFSGGRACGRVDDHRGRANFGFDPVWERKSAVE
jgi:hypothetical protein